MSGEASGQEVFETCYRDRQSWLHHASYLRVAKVFMAQRALRAAGVDLRGRRVLDYGFGAGAFLRSCPPEAVLFGVEQDPVTVDQVSAMLRASGHAQVHLEPIEIRAWASHRIFESRYDVVHSSHVLEHLPDPAAFLEKVRSATAPDGRFLGVVPCNERAPDAHHLHAPSREHVERWAHASGWTVERYEENDPYLYWAQPLYTFERGPQHRLAQALSLGLGLPASLLGPDRWFERAAWFARLTRSLPTQAAFVLAPA